MPMFFNHIEKRNGVVLNDWLLARVPSYDMSYPIFAIIWGMAILTVIRATRNPDIFIKYVWTLIFINLARFTSISLVVLDPPRGLIHLVDPISGLFYGNASITKDLFFSGHTSTLVLMFLCLQKRTDKIIGFIATIALVILLVIQHIHYTIDIVAAPFIVYALFTATCYFLKLDKVKKAPKAAAKAA
ncbi:hypothetical protein FFF34_001380 [Inquilinus sp. KBS0705]|nr:hypothetical protein FFF34_001380 [Inquilinus sp. KBS0705]